jgi:hypothetical protein
MTSRIRAGLSFCFTTRPTRYRLNLETADGRQLFRRLAAAARRHSRAPRLADSTPG